MGRLRISSARAAVRLAQRASRHGRGDRLTEEAEQDEVSGGFSLIARAKKEDEAGCRSLLVAVGQVSFPANKVFCDFIFHGFFLRG